MTETQWAAELAIALYGTKWVVDSTRVMDGALRCQAIVHRRVTKGSKQVDVSLDIFRTPARRKTEALRQLSTP